ncbi:DUF4012 domain-containing protein [Nitriliruptoraceae bacterium ZYF776]|nr:DUF4012 domain-containing protein [Profundirhabdus halotolerans]
MRHPVLVVTRRIRVTGVRRPRTGAHGWPARWSAGCARYGSALRVGPGERPRTLERTGMSDVEGAAPPVRHKRKRRRSRRRVVRTWAVRVVLVLLVVAVVAAALLAYQGLRARQALETARSALEAAQELVLTDPSGAQQRVEVAQTEAARARSLTRGPHWSVAAVLPLAGPSVATVRDLADLTDAVSGVGAASLPLVSTLRGGLTFEDGRLPVEPLVELRDVLVDADTPRISAIDARLAGRTDAILLPMLRPLIDTARDAADELVRTVDVARVALDVAVPMLGGDGAGERGYLLAVQNPGELRGTGGLMGVVSEVRIDDGQLSLADVVSADPDVDDPFGVGNQLQRGLDLDDPVDRDEDFARRWDDQFAGAFFTSTNLDPDLPTAGPVIQAVYERSTDSDVDGVLLFDTLALQRIAEVTGPIRVPEAVLAGVEDAPTELEPGDVARTLLIDAYDLFGGPTGERRDYQNAVATAVIDQLFEGDWDPAEMVAALGDLVAERRLQVYSGDDAEQEQLDELGVAGSVQPARPGDLAAVYGVNTAGNKADVFLELSSAIDVTLGEPRRDEDGAAFLARSLTYRFEVANPADGAPNHDPYISETLDTNFGDRSRRERDGRIGLVRDLWSMHLPGGSALEGVTDGDASVGHRPDTAHGQTIVDVPLEIESGDTRGFEVASSANVRIEEDGGVVTYRFTLRRQPRAQADALELTIAPPDGWRVRDLDVSGRPPTVALDGTGDLRPIDGEVADDGRVQVTGDAGTDVVVELTLVAG